MTRLNFVIIVSSLFAINIYAQGQNDAIQKADTIRTIEKLKYQQQPGLALAASKIFFQIKDIPLVVLVNLIIFLSKTM